jgi:hypothetical protein
MKRKSTTAAFTTLALAVLLALLGQPSRAQDSGATLGKKVEEVSKNIKVLNGMPADQIIPTMEFYEASLNVGCEFCHAPGGLDKDDLKQKEVTRKMILMVRALNKENFGGRSEVTCYTCHRGSIEPVETPPAVGADYKFPNPDMPNEAPANKPLPGPPPGEVLDTYLKGLGGLAALNKVSTRVVKATLTESAGRGDGLTLELVSKGPDKDLSFLHTSIGDTIRVRNGDVGWEHNVFGVIRDVRGGEIDELKIKWDTLYFATHLKEMLSNLDSKQAKLDGMDVYEVSGLAWNHMPVVLSFGKGTGNLLRLVYFDQNDNGHSKIQVDFSDYRSVEGTRFPFHWTVAWALGYQSIRVDQFQQNVPVDDSRFVRPALAARGNGN